MNIEISQRILASSNHIFEPLIKEQIMHNIFDLGKKIAKDFSISFGRAMYLLGNAGYNQDVQTVAEIDMLDILYPEESEASKAAKKTSYCLICTEELTAPTLIALPCEHQFCRKCFTDYLDVIINSLGQNAIYKGCPQDGCIEKLDPNLFNQLLPGKAFLKYQNLLLNDILSSNQTYLACPNPGCEYILKSIKENQSLREGQLNIKCKCEHFFCNLCKEDAHKPVSCESLKKWQKFLGIDDISEMNQAWIKVNTKQCPRCQVNIEKNQGCMHMTCKNCKHEFCWICFKNWQGHSACVAPIPAKQLDEEREKLQKYSFYSERYLVYKKSVQQSKSQRKIQLERINSLKQQFPNIDIEFFTHSLDLIIECRMAVTYSFIIGYYIDPKKKEFFDFNIGELQTFLEKLDDLLQKNPLNFIDNQISTKSLKEEFMDFKQQVQHLSPSLEKYFNKVLTSFEKEIPELSLTQSKIYKPTLSKFSNNPNNLSNQSQSLEQNSIATLYKTNNISIYYYQAVKCSECHIKNVTTEYGMCEQCFENLFNQN